MLLQINTKNFRGVGDKAYSLDKITLIHGANGSGKSSAMLAAYVAIFGVAPTGKIKATTDAVYNGYCGEEFGKMELEIVSELGTLRRVYSKDEKGVSCTITFNGKKVNASDSKHLKDMLGVQPFSRNAFFSEKGAARTNIVCAFGGVDLDELNAMDSEILKANTKKKEFNLLKTNSSKALDDHSEVLQSMSVSVSGVNLSTAEKELAALELERRKLETEVSQCDRDAVNVECWKAELHQKMEELESLSSTEQAKSEALAMHDTYDLTSRLNELEKQNINVQNRDRLIERIAHLESNLPKNDYKNFSQEELDELKDQISKIEISGSTKDPVSDAVYDYGSKIFKEVVEADIEKESKAVVVAIMREHIAPFKKRIEAFKSDEMAVVTLENLKRELAIKRASRESYIKREQEIKSANDNILALNIEAKAYSDAKFDNKEYQKLQSELSKRNQLNEGIKEQEQKFKQIVATRERLTASIEKLSNSIKATKITDLKAAKKTIEIIDSQILNIKSAIVEHAKFEQQSSVIEKTKIEMKEYAEKSKEWTSKEKSLLAKKAQLIAPIKEKIESQADKILSPDRLEIDISGGEVYFSMVKPGGFKIDWSGLSDGELERFAISIGIALAGENGVVFSEVAEIDDDNFKKLLKDIVDREIPCQFVFSGHGSVMQECPVDIENVSFISLIKLIY